MTSPSRWAICSVGSQTSIVWQGNRNQGNIMASVLSNALVVFFIISFRFAVIFSRCDGSWSYCGSYQVCCRNQCVYGSSCLGQSCSMDSDCSFDESCCYNACQEGYDCSGSFCSTSNDCSVGQNCCENTCTYNDCEDPSSVIVGVVVGSFVAFFLVMMLVYYCIRRARLGGPGRAVMGRRVTTTIVTTTQSASHAPPRVHQQGYPYHSLPQYDLYQNAAPPPYSGTMATRSDLPPPYNPQTQRKPEEGHTSHPTYGAIPST